MGTQSWNWRGTSVLLSSLLGVAAAVAADRPSHTEQATVHDADRAAAIARKNTGGRVLDVRLMDEEDSSRAYAVRLLLDPGRVRTVVVDADSEQLR